MSGGLDSFVHSASVDGTTWTDGPDKEERSSAHRWTERPSTAGAKSSEALRRVGYLGRCHCFIRGERISEAPDVVLFEYR